MHVNITEQQYLDDNLQLAEPHFDEEATVLSARPVVPLNEIKEASSRKHLVFGLSMLASLIVGGLITTLIFKQRGQKPAAEIAGSAIAGFGANATDSAVSAPSAGEVKEDLTAEPEVNAAPEDKNAQVKVNPAVKPPETKTVRPIPEDAAVDTALEDISREERREMRRAERFEEWRLRRQAAREAGDVRGRRRRSEDDLLRIREIFEGSPRP